MRGILEPQRRAAQGLVQAIRLKLGGLGHERQRLADHMDVVEARISELEATVASQELREEERQAVLTARSNALAYDMLSGMATAGQMGNWVGQQAQQPVTDRQLGLAREQLAAAQEQYRDLEVLWCDIPTHCSRLEAGLRAAQRSLIAADAAIAAYEAKLRAAGGAP